MAREPPIHGSRAQFVRTRRCEYWSKGLRGRGLQRLFLCCFKPFGRQVVRAASAAADRREGRPRYFIGVRSAIPAVDEGFIGPTLDRSGLIRTTADLRDAVGVRYQALYDQGYTVTMNRVRQGLVANNPTAIGSEVDSFARTGLRQWLGSQGISEQMVRVNRRLYDPFGSGVYRIPDVYIPSTKSVFDGTIGFKTSEWDQTIQFHDFSDWGNVTIVRPTQMPVPAGQPQGSYGLIFRGRP